MSLFTVTTRADGTILTGAIYTADRQEIADALTPTYVDDYSTNLTQMRTQTDPGEIGTESLPTNEAGEWARIRYAIADIKAAMDPTVLYWYETPYNYTVYNVKAYGAVGDGVTSDRTAIQNTFNAACAAGQSKIVYFPPGSYFCGTNGGSTKIIDLSALGNGIKIITSGFVELVNTCTAGEQLPRFFYLSDNSDFYCDPIAFRDTNFDSTAVNNQGAIGFYCQTNVTSWGRLYFTRIYATTMTSPLILVDKTGVVSASIRLRDVYVGQIICNDTYYGFNSQNDGDNVFIGELSGYQCRRIYYVYGVQNHNVNILDRNPRGSTGKCYIARQVNAVSGLHTTGINIKYRSRDYNAGPSGSMVVIDHIDLLGTAEISNITVDVDVTGSLSSYYPVYFRNYDGSGGSVDPTTPANITRDIRLSGSCDANALDCYVAATYSAKRQMHFIPGYNFLPKATTLLTQFQLNQLSRSTTGLTWASSGTQPVLGNGTLVYDFDITNGIAYLNVKLTIGSTSTMGTGSWYFTGYSPALLSASDVIGSILCADTGVKWYTGVSKLTRNGSNIALLVDNNSNGVGPTIPFTWADGDYLIASIAFPISSLD